MTRAKGAQMISTEVLSDGYDRIRSVVHAVLDRASRDELAFRPDPDSNSAAWLIWHLARVQDDHIATAADSAQVWTSAGWYDRFGLPFAPDATGYGQSADEVGAVDVEPELLAGYYDALHERTLDYLRSLDDDALDRVVDENWDPPVTLAVRLISVLSDDLQHAGQASYVVGHAGRARG